MKRSGKYIPLSMTGVGAYAAPEHRMHSVAICACTNVLYEKKGAIVYVALNCTMEQAIRVENEACASRLCSADMGV